MNPAPATLASATSGGSSRLARMISAIARGGFFSPRAITSATLLAASPWAGSLGASTLAAAGGAVESWPAARARSIAAFRMDTIRSFIDMVSGGFHRDGCQSNRVR